MPRGRPHTLKSSDQMPEEAPAEQVPDDVPQAPEGAARESGRRHSSDAQRHTGKPRQPPRERPAGKDGQKRESRDR
jgi:hypothetical protein